MIRPAGQKGVALLMVIWVLAALAVILSEFVYAGRSSLNAARNQKTAAVGYYLARGAVELALEDIRGKYSYLLPGEDGGVRFVRPGVEEADLPAFALRSGKLPGMGKYSYLITDEESKINLNRLDRKQLVEFFRGAGVSLGAERDTLIDSILDWRDPDNLHRLNGAEDDYYQSLTPPYRAKNADFSTPQELLLVRGMTPGLFAGEGRGEGEGRALEDLVSVYSDRPNYNTAPLEVLAAWLGPAEGEKIAAQRQATPFKDNRGQSSFFTVVAQGTPEGSSWPFAIRAVVNRRGEASRRGDTLIVQWTDLTPAPPQAEASR